MKLEFSPDELIEFEDDLDELCEDDGPLFSEVNECGESISATRYRIVAPELHRSFRLADAFTDGECWGELVVVEYEENEKDVNKYLSFATSNLSSFINYNYDIYPNCYIETDEFIEEKKLKEILDDDEDEFPALRAVIAGKLEEYLYGEDEEDDDEDE